MGMFFPPPGTLVRFVYADKPREGVVDSEVAVAKTGGLWFRLKTSSPEGEVYRSFNLHKVQGQVCAVK